MALRRRGMTMVELLVAGAIGVGLMLMLYGSMSSSARRFRTGEAGLESNLQAQRILEYLRRDINGTYSWGPCDAPKEVLEFAGFSGGEAFALAPRFVEHRFEYYRQGSGPISQETMHQASPKRVPAGGPGPCSVRWDVDASRWLLNPRTDRETKDMKVMAHRVEVTIPKGNARAVWIMGPAYWVFDEKGRVLKRFTEEDGVVSVAEFGKGRLLEAKMLPVLENSYDTRTTPKGTYVAVKVNKRYLSVSLTFDREVERVPLEIHSNVMFTGS